MLTWFVFSLQVQGSHEGFVLPTRGLLRRLGLPPGADEDPPIAPTFAERVPQSDVSGQPL